MAQDTEKRPETLVGRLHSEIVRVRDIKAVYEDMHKREGVNCAPVLYLIARQLEQAEDALNSGDILKMLPAVKNLENWEL